MKKKLPTKGFGDSNSQKKSVKKTPRKKNTKINRLPTEVKG